MSRLNGFLAGVRVIDLSRNLPGPFATRMLADLGADVLKIEPPEGDVFRTRGPRTADGKPAYFEALHAGKSITTLDLKQAGDRARLLELLGQADVLVENYRPGMLDRLELSHQRLRDANPRLVICSLTAFGQSGPKAQAPGFDATFLALSGMLREGPGASGPSLDPPLPT